MTRTANARIAGVTYLAYIAFAFPSMVISSRATAGETMAAKLATIAQHTGDLRLSIVLNLLSALCALTLAVTLYAITRDEDRDLGRLGFACRVGEGVVGSVPVSTLGLMWLATPSGPLTPDPGAAQAIGAFLMRFGLWQTQTAATLFAVGSTVFCYLLLRGRMIPTWLASLGLIGSAIVAVGVPLEMVGALRGTPAQLQWIPIALFEITVSVWFIVKGVRPAR
jgi:hypothetical protein